MKYFSTDEIPAIKQMADRVAGDTYGDWTKEDILRPEGSWRMKPAGGNGVNSFAWEMNPHYERMNELELFQEYLNLKINYPPFVHIVCFPKSNPARHTDNRHLQMWNAFSFGGKLKPVSGDAFYNYYDRSKMERATRIINPLRVTCRETGVYAELLDVSGSNDGDKIKAVKILMLRNPSAPNPHAVRRTVHELIRTIICTLKYDIVWGNPLELDDENYPHNSEEDKRFEVWDTINVESSEGETTELKVTRLARYWDLMGLGLIMSPEGGKIGCGAVSEGYKRHLLKRDQKLWSSFF